MEAFKDTILLFLVEEVWIKNYGPFNFLMLLLLVAAALGKQ